MDFRTSTAIDWGPKLSRTASWAPRGHRLGSADRQSHLLGSLLGHHCKQNLVHQDLNAGCYQPRHTLPSLSNSQWSSAADSLNDFHEVKHPAALRKLDVHLKLSFPHLRNCGVGWVVLWGWHLCWPGAQISMWNCSSSFSNVVLSSVCCLGGASASPMGSGIFTMESCL